MAATSPSWSPVVRPYFWTACPTNACAVTGLGAPYPSAGVSVPTFADDVSAIAASIVFVPPSKSIV